MKKEDLISVRAQVQYVNYNTNFDFDTKDFHMRRIAQEIGLEMMKNDLIEFDESDDGHMITIKGKVLIYKKSEEE